MLISSHRRSARTVVVAAATAVLALALPAASLALPNPAISTVAPDPSVVRAADGSFHLYATSDDWADGAGSRLMPHFRSFDLVEWEYVGDAFAAAPAWLPRGSFLWAPDMHVVDGEYRMYYTTGGAKPCIGMASAPGVDGPWTDLGHAIVCMGDGTDPALDPMDPFVDFSGEKPVMYMGNFEGVHAVEMNAEGTALEGDAIDVAGEGYEAPLIARREGKTHIFLSAGNCCNGEASGYHVVAARGDGPLGPFVDRSGRDLRDGGGDTVLEGNAEWVGPGHPDIVTDDAGQDWMLYHAAPRGTATLPNGVQRRQLLVDRIDWVDGWPKVANGTPVTNRPADPSVALPVRLDRRDNAPIAGVAGDQAIDVPAVVESTGEAYAGVLWASITGPNKRPISVPIRTAEGDAPEVPVAVGAGEKQSPSYQLVLPENIAAGQYEVTLHVGQTVGADQEIAVYGLRVGAAGIPIPDPLGSLPLGSSTIDLGSLQNAAGSLGS